ncbi:voltage-gated potassium channel [mine drainage metagenome]|uniref:Voltage-gated potassium channel n=1 Tax=mine drainage metagenome TaxID=410659 RepID=T0YX05_9ZZZZ
MRGLKWIGRLAETSPSQALPWLLGCLVMVMGVLNGVDSGLWRSMLLDQIPPVGPSFAFWIESLLWSMALILFGTGLLFRSRLSWFMTLIALAARLLWLTDLGRFWSHPAFSLAALVALLILLKSGNRFRRSTLGAGTLFALTLIILLLAYAVLGSFLLGDQFNPPIRSLITALYFSVVTLSTVGYGDITPHSAEARMFVSSIIVLGLTVLAVALSAIILPVLQRRLESLLMPNRVIRPRHNHFLIAGNSSLARNTYRELNARKQKVTFIVSEPFEIAGEGKLDIVIGDPTDTEVLRSVQAGSAKALLALSDDDSENAFVVLAAKELEAPVKTVAVVHNSKNLSRLRRVHPDILLAPQVMGGRVLAMYLTGQNVDAGKFWSDFLTEIAPGHDP